MNRCGLTLIAVLMLAALSSGFSQSGPFKARTATEASQWQTECRLALAKGFGMESFLQGRHLSPLNERHVAQEDRGDFTIHQVTLDVMPGWTIPALVTVPKTSTGRLPAVVFVEAHKEYVYPEGGFVAWHRELRERGLKEGTLAYGASLAKLGYVTIAADCLVASPLAPDFQKRSRLTHSMTPDYARDKDTHRRSSEAERIQIGLRLVDYLCSRDDVATNRLGIVGLCKWGAAASQMAAMDLRIKAVVSACTLIRDSKGETWPSPFGPGQPPFDLLDLYSLIAPRPVLCQFGEKDGYRPQYPTEAELKEVQRRYEVVGGQPADLEVYWHPGGHKVEQSSLPGFFAKALAQSGGTPPPQSGRNKAHPALVFLIAGQSNAGGIASFSPELNFVGQPKLAAKNKTLPGSTAREIGLPFSADVYSRSFIWSAAKKSFQPFAPGTPLMQAGMKGDWNRHGIELPLAWRLEQAFPDHDKYFIKYGRGGSNLYDQWNPARKGSYFHTFIDFYRGGMAELKQRRPEVRVVALYWDQGESDLPHAKDYERNLTALVAAMRKETGQPALKVFLRKQLFNQDPAFQPIIEAQVKLAACDDHAVLLDLDLGSDEANFKAWAWVDRNGHLSSKAFLELTDRMLAELKPGLAAQ